MNDGAGITGWVLAGVGAIMGTLSSIIAMFYKTQISDYRAHILALEESTAALTLRADSCENDREQLRIRQARMEEQYALLEQRVQRVEHEKDV